VTESSITTHFSSSNVCHFFMKLSQSESTFACGKVNFAALSLKQLKSYKSLFGLIVYIEHWMFVVECACLKRSPS